MQASVAITNTGAGHHVPTDHPGRHLILTLAAQDSLGGGLVIEDGPLVPDWGGEQAGLPGTVYAKVLRDVKSGHSPVVSYWKPSQIVSDNRIPALEGDRSSYTFTLPAPGGAVSVTAELRFRRAFNEIMQSKGWEMPDIMMETASASFVADPYWALYIPLVLGE